MESELQKAISMAEQETAAITLLVGQDCNSQQPIRRIAESCSGTLPREQNCIEMILGPEKTKELQQNRTTIMTPAWFRMIKASIDQGLWTVEDARMNLGWYDQIILLDTGAEPLDDMMIMDFFELIQVPIDILPVSLERFKRLVCKLLPGMKEEEHG